MPDRPSYKRAATSSATTAGGSAAAVAAFLDALAAGYARSRTTPGASVAAAEEREQELLLAQAAVRYADPPGARTAAPAIAAAQTDAPAASPPPLHLAVVGPTQTGKSTVVNLLLGAAGTTVSPLAGFTVHPIGLCVGGASPTDNWAAGLFPGWPRTTPAQLDRERLDAYALVAAPPPTDSTLFDAGADGWPPSVVWDTPDFDSLAARRYARGVLEVAALADLHVLVLSREKYSDLAVWRFLELVAPLGRRLLICLNKLTPEAHDVICRSLAERLQARGDEFADARVVTLPEDWALSAQPGHPAGGPLRAAVRETLAATDSAGVQGAAGSARDAANTTSTRRAGAAAFVRRHWDAWLTPVLAEQAALDEWRQLVATAGEQFVAAYERDYLNHPQRYDCFRRASLELLNLLEIPALGGVLSQARRTLTWPVRKVLAAGNAWWRDRRPAARLPHVLGAEAGVLVDAAENLLTGLARDVLRRAATVSAGQVVWQGLAAALEREQPALRARFDTAIQAHHVRVDAEVRQVANSLYAELRKHPTRLNALRTARAAIDVGYMLLAVKTAGLTPLDAVWAPATFALTSLLTEGFAGMELHRLARGVKARQRAAVADELGHGLLERELVELAGGDAAGGLFGLSAEQVSAATAALAQWEKGA